MPLVREPWRTSTLGGSVPGLCVGVGATVGRGVGLAVGRGVGLGVTIGTGDVVGAGVVVAAGVALAGGVRVAAGLELGTTVPLGQALGATGLAAGVVPGVIDGPEVGVVDGLTPWQPATASTVASARAGKRGRRVARCWMSIGPFAVSVT